MPWTPTPDDDADVLSGMNPWWLLGRVPAEFAKPRERALGRSLHRALDRPRQRYQLILGPRRVGKTTVMHQTAARLLGQGVEPQRVCWLTMNVPLLMNLTLQSWVNLITRNATVSKPVYLLLDEINYADKWDLWLKDFYDRQLPIRVAATSSSTAALKNRFVESGVGRWEEQHLSPCSFAEYLELIGKGGDSVIKGGLREALSQAAVASPAEFASHDQDLRRYLMIGGFPELLVNAPEADLPSEVLRSQHVLRADAIQRAVAMDIPQVFSVNEPIKLERLLYLLAGQTGSVASPSKLASELSLSVPTVHQYLSYLERAFLVISLPNYGPSEETIQRRGRKIYFVDAAMRSAALYRGIAPLQDPAELGELMENAAVAHLHALGLQTGVRVFHWRDQRDEVDCVYDDPNGPVAVEVTSSKRHRQGGLRSFLERHPSFKGGAYIVSTGSGQTPSTDADNGIGRISFDRFLLTCGHLAASWQEKRLGL